MRRDGDRSFDRVIKRFNIFSRGAFANAGGIRRGYLHRAARDRLSLRDMTFRLGAAGIDIFKPAALVLAIIGDALSRLDESFSCPQLRQQFFPLRRRERCDFFQREGGNHIGVLAASRRFDRRVHSPT